jgi:hypothetical protein
MKIRTLIALATIVAATSTTWSAPASAAVIGPGKTRPDLVFSQVTAGSVVVKNVGNVTAYGFTVKISGGSNGVFAVGPVWRNVGQLKPGQILFIQLQYWTGTRSAVVDFYDDVAELSELNNAAIVPGTWPPTLA